MIAALRRVAPVLGLVGLALAFAAPQLGGEIEWGTDPLFYEGQKHELQGESKESALRRVWSGPAAAEVRRQVPQAGLPRERQRYTGEWVSYSSQFYRRRWLVPAMAAAADPLLGLHAVETVSILAYVLLGPLLYALLRRRFSPRTSLVVAAFCLLLKPVRDWALLPQTDGWGLLLGVVALLAAVLVLERGPRWLLLWILSMFALSLTRDMTVVLVIATAWLALRERTRRTVALAVSGVVAAAPVPGLFGGSVRESLAYAFSDFRVPIDSSWSWVLDNYWSNFGDTVSGDLGYPFERTLAAPLYLVVALLAVAGLAVLIFKAPRQDAYFRLHRAAAAGALLTILVSVNYSHLRLELVFVPPIAVGLALGLDRAIERARALATARVRPAEA